MNDSFENITGHLFNITSWASSKKMEEIYHTVILVLGIPLTLTVALVLALNKRLHNTRNAIWAGILISNMVLFILLALELFFFTDESYMTCSVAFNGQAIHVLLLNAFLMNCERILYTKWPRLHNRHVTVPKVISLHLVGSIVVLAVSSVDFWVFSEPTECGADPLVNLRSDIGSYVLILTCLASSCALYVVARVSLKEQRRERNANIPMREVYNNPLRATSENPEDRISHMRITYFYITPRTRRMEIRAIRAVMFSCILLCLFTLPFYLLLMSQYLCFASSKLCWDAQSLEHYFSELRLLYFVTSLLPYIIHSKEFRIASSATLCCQSPTP